MLRWGSGSACSKPTLDLTQVLEYMSNIVEINCSFLVQGFEAVNINILKRFQKLILISLHVIYIILSPWIEIRPLSLTSNPPNKCLRNYILSPIPCA